MKKELKIIIVCMIIYTINRLLKKYINIPILGYLCKCYVSDFICGIVFCSYVNLVLIKGGYKTITKYYQIFILIFFSGILWEYFFPIFISYSVSDKYDLLAYILGGTVYYFIKKRKWFIYEKK